MPSNEEGTQEKGTTSFHANAASIDELRRTGNSYFSQGDYDSALSLYSSAIDQSSSLTDRNNLILNLCNRSACFFKMERYEEARNDALEAVKKTEEKNSAASMALVSVEKAVFRLARAEIALQNYKGAIECLEKFLSSSTSAETSELQKLLNYARNMEKNGSQVKPAWNASNKKVPTPSIKEFEIQKLLGEGNFSSIYSCQHKETNRVFALKVVEKKKVESLAKREHPNAYNEVNMERRVLGERLRSSDHPTHPFVIHMYHAFQDYQNLYLLMDLHEGELWSCIRYQGKLVGCHASLVRFYLAELVEVLEYIHSKGIVHRDLKAENILIAKTGHIVLIDFGTAKDLNQTDLNGPDFVGTPDFMSPEAVKGTDESLSGSGGVDHTADLWALGAVAYQLYTGDPPFTSQSPYLTFLKIQRGNVYRPMVITDDDAWEFIKGLLQVDPCKRLGANCVPVDKGCSKLKPTPGNLSEIKSHPFFTRGTQVEKYGINLSNFGGEVRLDIGSLHEHPALKVPTLKDLCIRACAQLIRLDSLNLDAPDPGDGSNHDMLRLNTSDRAKVMHVLDRLFLLSEPRIFRRLFQSKQDARLSRIRESTHDCIGLTFREEGKPKEHETGSEDPDPIKIIHLTNPLFLSHSDSDELSEQQHIDNIALLKTCIRFINRIRPKFVVVSGKFIDQDCRNLLAKINETIPLILCDGSHFLSVWHSCNEALVLSGGKFIVANEHKTSVEEERCHYSAKEYISSVEGSNEAQLRDEQILWLKQELEQIKVPRRKVIAFVENDPRTVPRPLLKRLAKSGTVCVLGCCKDQFRMKCELGDDDTNLASEMATSTDSSDTDDEGHNSNFGSKEEDKVRIDLISSTLTLVSMEAKYGAWTAEDISP